MNHSRKLAHTISLTSDVAGLCSLATMSEIEAQGWSLNPGRYVGVAKGLTDEFEFGERLEELNEELEASSDG